MEICTELIDALLAKEISYISFSEYREQIRQRFGELRKAKGEPPLTKTTRPYVEMHLNHFAQFMCAKARNDLKIDAIARAAIEKEKSYLESNQDRLHFSTLLEVLASLNIKDGDRAFTYKP